MRELCHNFWKQWAQLKRNNLRDLDTPYYAYSGKLIQSTLHALRESLPNNSEILYSVKANPHAGFIRCLGKLGVLYDVASRGEMELIVNQEGSLKRAVWISPCKKMADYVWALQNGINATVVDSEEEVSNLLIIAQKSNFGTCNILLRLDLSSMKRGSSLWGFSQFGLPIEEAHRLTLKLMHEGIQIAGIHAYLGSNMLDANEIINNTRLIVNKGRAWSDWTGLPLQLLDCGGGFGWPMNAAEPALPLKQLQIGLAEVAATIFPSTKIWFESGRFLTAGCGVLIVTVMSVKERAGKSLVIVDGGMNVFGLPSMRLGFRPLTIVPLGLKQERRLMLHTVFGPLCTPGDKLCENCLFPEIRPGDRLMILDAGAYGASAARPAFLSFPAVNEVFLD